MKSGASKGDFPLYNTSKLWKIISKSPLCPSAEFLDRSMLLLILKHAYLEKYMDIKLNGFHTKSSTN